MGCMVKYNSELRCDKSSSEPVKLYFPLHGTCLKAVLLIICMSVFEGQSVYLNLLSEWLGRKLVSWYRNTCEYEMSFQYSGRLTERH